MPARMRNLLLLSAIGVISACDAGIFIRVGNDYDEVEAEALALIDDVAALEDTAVEDMPAGDAVYAGYFAGTVSIGADDENVVGDLNLTADFDFETIDGSIDNLIGETEGGIAGSLDVFNGDIVLNGFSADIDGTMTLGIEDYDIEGAALGTFKGDSADALEGILGGDVYQGVDDVGDISGSLAAQ